MLEDFNIGVWDLFGFIYIYFLCLFVCLFGLFVVVVVVVFLLGVHTKCCRFALITNPYPNPNGGGGGGEHLCTLLLPERPKLYIVLYQSSGRGTCTS